MSKQTGNPIKSDGSGMFLEDTFNTNNQNLGTNISYGKIVGGFQTPSTNYS